MNNKIELSPEIKEKLLDPSLLPESIMVSNQPYSIIEPIDAGYKGAVWKAKDKFGRDRAVKLTTTEDYKGCKRSYADEIQWAESLAVSNIFSRLDDASKEIISLKNGEQFEFVIFIEEWIPGTPLKKYIAKFKDKINYNFIISFIKATTEALSILETNNLRHDDLHSGNVMVCDPIPGSMSNKFYFKIIDMGSLKHITGPTKKTYQGEENWDDHLNFVKMIVELHNTAHRESTFSINQKRFFYKLAKIIERMIDNDPLRALRDHKSIIREIDEASTYAITPSFRDSVKFNYPFAYISAEQIANDELLVELFAEKCPWLGKISGPDPCIVTGPRGCGKSTIFRWLSLKPHLKKCFNEIKKLQFSGFYISCSTSLQNRFFWITDEALATRYKNEIVHYFNMLLAQEIIQTLEFIVHRNDRDNFFFQEITEEKLLDYIASSLYIENKLIPQGISSLARIREIIERELFETHRVIISGKNLSKYTNESFIGDFTTLLTKHILFFQQKRITFLVDDYSLHRVPKNVQIILNKIIWERRSSHLFKVSSEKHGICFILPGGGQVDLTREVKEIDCGHEFINLSFNRQQEQAKAFTIQLLNNRLKRAEYEGTAKTILGETKWKDNSLARCLIESKGSPKNSCYHGTSCISQICSGDISTLLMIFEEIFIKGDVNKTTRSVVPPYLQHESITDVSRKMFERIKTIHPHGIDMYKIVTAFGSLQKNLLYEGKTLKGNKPIQAPRIEIDADAGDVYAELEDNLQEIAKALIQRSIFIEMNPGAGREGTASTLRWHLRRIYLPHFSATLSKNMAIIRKPNWFSVFISDPERACNEIFLTAKRDKKPNNTTQFQLLDSIEDIFKS